MLPDAILEHWTTIRDLIPEPLPASLQLLTEKLNSNRITYDQQTRENFSYEWENHELGGTTWGMELADRVKWFFLEPLRIPHAELQGKVVLDAGCGNGSQSVAYTELGLEVVAVDLSSGLEHGYAYRHVHPGADPARVHFVQGDLQRPPLAPASVDIIHSAGVLHHTPDTLQTFRALRPLLRQGGTFYVWLYKYEKWVTPIVNGIRTVTTRVSPSNFAPIAQLMAVPFIAFCKTVNALRIRSYGKMTRRESALALMDIFGAPYAYYHSFDEVAEWYRAAGFTEVWFCNEGRRGFGVCGRFGKPTVSSEEGVQTRIEPEPMQHTTSVMQGKSA
ncbi:MAG TPA: class I SAM-dependent methyltransferase [Pyrinomonadaceae bacterium]|nr:class I SAM-dependent methyltransferase [Pyrinomonadaceae bacterium]